MDYSYDATLIEVALRCRSCGRNLKSIEARFQYRECADCRSREYEERRKSIFNTEE